ncbi:Uncharacterized protein APZ42_000845 [Daphnia magna]|uniref:Uncharacterized protein n=1 Tax=Daphnia magna TaxID=35525 RepID=A0A164JCC6_9CRUS|nr:Uncharacterized protein APZ42_000845 [Daphnia magna]
MIFKATRLSQVLPQEKRESCLCLNWNKVEQSASVYKRERLQPSS